MLIIIQNVDHGAKAVLSLPITDFQESLNFIKMKQIDFLNDDKIYAFLKVTSPSCSLRISNLTKETDITSNAS